MKLNRSMNTSVMAAARSIELRATAKSDTTILKAYKAFQRVCDAEKKYATHMLNYSDALIYANSALIEIEDAIKSVGRHGTKYFEDEFIQSSAEVLDRDCPDITGQINAMYNNIATLEQLNTIYLSAKAVEDRIAMYMVTQADDPEKKEKSNAAPSVKDEKADRKNDYSVDKLKNDIFAFEKRRGGQPKIKLND